MASHNTSGSPSTPHGENRATLRGYVYGFVASVLLTCIAYLSVTKHIFERGGLLALVASLAIVQFFVQLFFFLHLGHESKPRWRILIFSFMLLVVVIVVFGSIWIMQNLDYHHMTPTETKNYLRSHEGI